MDRRLDPVPIVATFAAAVRPVADVVGLYVGGSLAAGDYQPDVSDLDVVAIVGSRLDSQQLEHLRALHVATSRADPAAMKLHCAYVPLAAARDLATPHSYWAYGDFHQRPVSGIARAEVLNGGITVFGPAPVELLPRLDRAAVQRAARAELTGYWSGAARKPWLWFDDLYVDLGLLTLARVEATLEDGRLITKREAITRLHRFGVDAELIEQIAQRRHGETVTLSRVARARRAYAARRCMVQGIRGLT